VFNFQRLPVIQNALNPSNCTTDFELDSQKKSSQSSKIITIVQNQHNLPQSSKIIALKSSLLHEKSSQSSKIITQPEKTPSHSKIHHDPPKS
jgi:hypothetical protein